MVTSTAKLRHIRITPMKARRVVDLVRGRQAIEALAILKDDVNSDEGKRMVQALKVLAPITPESSQGPDALKALIGGGQRPPMPPAGMLGTPPTRPMNVLSGPPMGAPGAA